MLPVLPLSERLFASSAANARRRRAVGFHECAVIAGAIVCGVAAQLGLFEVTVVLAVTGIALLITLIRSFSSSGTFEWGYRTFVAGVLGWYVYPGILADVSPSLVAREWLSATPETSFRQAALCVVVFSAFGLAGSAAVEVFRARRRDRAAATIRGPVARIAFCAVLLGVVPMAMLGGSPREILNTALASRGTVKPWAQVGNLGDSVTPFLALARAAMTGGAVVLGTCALDSHRPRLVRGICAIFAFGAALLIYVDTGTRSTFGLIAVPLVALWLRNRSASSRVRSFAVAAMAGAAIIAALQFQLHFRSEVGQTDVGKGVGWNILTLDGTIDYFSETAFSVSIVPAFHDYFHESALLHFVVTLIPRFAWRGKPVPEILPYYSFRRNGWDIYSDGGNLLPGVIGQQYMSWGWLGVMGTGFVLGWLMRWLDMWAAERSGRNSFTYALYMMCCAYCAISFRYLAPGFLYPVAAAAAIVFVARRPRKARRWASTRV